MIRHIRVFTKSTPSEGEGLAAADPHSNPLKGNQRQARRVLSLAVQPGLSHQLVVESHDLGQIQVAAPSDDIDADGPDEESSSGLIGAVFHAPTSC